MTRRWRCCCGRARTPREPELHSSGVDMPGSCAYSRVTNAVAHHTMNYQKTYWMKRLCLSLLLVATAFGPREGFASARGGRILLGENASPMEQYAARELQRYLYQVSGSLLRIEAAAPAVKLSGLVFLLGRPE